MIRLAGGVLLALVLVAGCAWLWSQALTVAGGGRPSMTPAEQERFLAATKPTREVAAKQAADGKAKKPKPVTFTRKFQPPKAALMAAKTGVTMGEIWNGTLEVNNEPQSEPPPPSPVTTTVTLSSLGASVSVSWDGEATYAGDVVSEERNEAYWRYVVTASAPDDSDSADIYVHCGVTTPMINTVPSGAVVVENLSVGVALSVQGVYLKRSRVASPPDDRQIMDFSDLDATDLWYADDTSTVTATVTGDIALSAAGSIGYTPGDEVEIGSSYLLVASITSTYFPAANTTYGRISGIKWGTTAVDLGALPVYNPGDASGIPSADISPWSRIWTTNDALAIVDDSGMALQRLTALSWWPGQSYTGTLKWSAMREVTLTAIDDMFDNDGPAYSPRIEYAGPFLQWDYVGGAWVSSALPFTDTYTAAEFPSNYEYEHEYSLIATGAVTVTVTEDWRDAQGEDVGNAVTGGDAVAYNDRLAPLLLLPLTATDCIASPWWTPGIDLTHVASLDLNDTEGQVRRASWWLGGVGVDIDPTDNDKWTVTAGALAPAVSRSWRTRYWLRMERLQEKKNDPEAEHSADWPIMLKANIAIGETLDDSDWWIEPTVSVTGAGTSGVNDDYAENGSAGGQQQYGTGPVYIRYNRALAQWEIIEGGAVYYTCPTLTGTWVVQDGSSPAPSVGLVQSTEYGIGSMLLEDVYNWANYSYVSLRLDAPRNGTIQVAVDYSVPSVSDPCYTGFAYRFGDDADLFGGWDYTRASFRLTWGVPVVAGDHVYLLDLACNLEGAIPAEAYRIQVVSAVALTLLDNEGETDEDWELVELQLVEDTGETGRAAPAEHLFVRYKPSWSWIDPAWKDDDEQAVHAPENWFGFGGTVDGLPCLQVDAGYDSPFGRTGQEKGLLYIQRSQHNPLYTGPASRLDYAKSLARWYAEVSWQEGFSITYPTPPPQEAAENQDADDDQVDGSFYWWDLRQSDESMDWTDAGVALAVGSWALAAGVPYEIKFHKHPRGIVHGLKRQTVLGVTTRVRDEADAVEFYGSEDGGAWALLETPDTDQHGSWKSLPVREKDWEYRVGTDGATRTVVNRSYTLDGVDVVAAFNWEGFLDLDESGLTWLVAVGQGALHVYWIGAGADAARHEVTQPTTAAGHSRPSIAVAGGDLLVAATLGSDTVIYRSRNRGETWALVATDLGDGLTLGTIAWRETGEVMLCGVDATDAAVLRMASDGLLTRDDLTPGVDELTIIGSVAGMRTCCVRQSDGSIMAAVEGSGQVALYRCRDFGTGFAAL